MSTTALAQVFAGLLGELGGEHPYTWGGKGWGPPLPDGGGLDCSGFAQGLLQRVGRMQHQAPLASHQLRDYGRQVNAPALWDVLYWPGHVGVVLVPGLFYLDAGGGGSTTAPGGEDWPTLGRAGRLRKWGDRGQAEVVVRIDDATDRDWELVALWRRYAMLRAVGANAGLPAQLAPYYREVR